MIYSVFPALHLAVEPAWGVMQPKTQGNICNGRSPLDNWNSIIAHKLFPLTAELLCTGTNYILKHTKANYITSIIMSDNAYCLHTSSCIESHSFVQSLLYGVSSLTLGSKQSLWERHVLSCLLKCDEHHSEKTSVMGGAHCITPMKYLPWPSSAYIQADWHFNYCRQTFLWGKAALLVA